MRRNPHAAERGKNGHEGATTSSTPQTAKRTEEQARDAIAAAQHREYDIQQPSVVYPYVVL